MPKAPCAYYERLIDGVAEIYLRPVARGPAGLAGETRILDVGTGTGSSR